MSDPDARALADAVRATADRDGPRHVGLVVGAVTSAGARSVATAGRLRAPDGPTPAADSLFEIGSVTKVFTGLLLAEAVVRGELALDTPVRDLLPGVEVPSRDGVAITVEHLATHTSGLPRDPVPLPAALLAQWRARDGDPWAVLDRDGLMTALAGSRLRRTPGTGRVRYSNTGVGVLGHALVAASGEPDYAALVQARVCAPLGLSDTVLLPTAAQAGREADGHRRGRPTGHWEVAALPGAGALRSTAADVLTFLHAQLCPDDTPLGPALRLSQQERRPGRRLGMGLGWLRVRVPGGPALLWHDGGTGGFRAFAGLAPETGAGVVVLANDRRGVDGPGLALLRSLGA